LFLTAGEQISSGLSRPVNCHLLLVTRDQLSTANCNGLDKARDSGIDLHALVPPSTRARFCCFGVDFIAGTFSLRNMT
jgi:hypothetical protein